MQDYQIKQLGLIMAEFIRGLGLVAENMQRQTQGESMAYTDESFTICANQIEFLARQLD